MTASSFSSADPAVADAAAVAVESSRGFGGVFDSLPPETRGSGVAGPSGEEDDGGDIALALQREHDARHDMCRMAAERGIKQLPEGVQDITLPCFQVHNQKNRDNSYGRKHPEAGEQMHSTTVPSWLESYQEDHREASAHCCKEKGDDEQPTGNVTPPWPPEQKCDGNNLEYVINWQCECGAYN